MGLSSGFLLFAGILLLSSGVCLTTNNNIFLHLKRCNFSMVFTSDADSKKICNFFTSHIPICEEK